MTDHEEDNAELAGTGLKWVTEMTDTKQTELLPCPFCGGEAKLKGGPMAQEFYSVWCENGHHLEGSLHREATMIKWNTRQPTGDPQ